MSDIPSDPASESINQAARETEGFEGQQGYGVQFEDGQFEGEVEQTPPAGRTGSFESGNQGGYGTGQTDADGERHGEQGPPAPPEPDL